LSRRGDSAADDVLGRMGGAGPPTPTRGPSPATASFDSCWVPGSHWLSKSLSYEPFALKRLPLGSDSSRASRSITAGTCVTVLGGHRLFTDPKVWAEIKEIFHYALIGLSVTKGAKQPRSRRHDLADLIERTFVARSSDGHVPTATEVLKGLEQHDDECIIQEITSEAIFWRDRRGNERTMKIGTFRNRVSKIRKSCAPA